MEYTKTSDVTLLKQQLTGALIGLSRAAQGNEDLLTPETDRVVIHGLLSTAPDHTIHPASLRSLLQQADDQKRLLVPGCFTCTASCGRTDNYDLDAIASDLEETRTVKLHLLSELRTLANFCARQIALGASQAETMPIFYQALFVIGLQDCTPDPILPIARQVDTLIRQAGL